MQAGAVIHTSLLPLDLGTLCALRDHQSFSAAVHYHYASVLSAGCGIEIGPGAMQISNKAAARLANKCVEDMIELLPDLVH